MNASREHGSDHGRRRTRWPLDFPSVVVVLLFFGACWPASPRASLDRVTAPTRFRQISGPGLSANTRLELVAFMRPPDAIPVIEVDPALAVFESALSPQPHYLGTSPEPSIPVRPPDPDPRREAAQRMRGYHPAWTKDDPFQIIADSSLRFVVEYSASLGACEFRLPPEWLRGLDGGDVPWDLTVDLLCREDGSLRDAFQASDATLTPVKREIVRRLFQGAAAPGPACGGAITVRWVRVPLAGEQAGGNKGPI